MDLPTEQIGDALFTVTRSLKALTEKELKPLGLGTGQLQILMQFYAGEATRFTQNGLVAILQIDKGNVSRNIAKLVEKKYLRMREDGSRNYELTAEGALLKRELVLFLKKIHRTMVEGLSPEELHATMKGLSRISMNLEEST